MRRFSVEPERCVYVRGHLPHIHRLCSVASALNCTAHMRASFPLSTPYSLLHGVPGTTRLPPRACKQRTPPCFFSHLHRVCVPLQSFGDRSSGNMLDSITTLVKQFPMASTASPICCGHTLEVSPLCAVSHCACPSALLSRRSRARHHAHQHLHACR